MSAQRRYAAVLLLGIAIVPGARWCINHTSVADWLVAPLVTEDTNGPADAIVVLGAGVIGECVPNHYGVGRVLLAMRRWREGRAPLVLFTGASSAGTCPASVAMAALGQQIGIPQASIVVEPSAKNTYENSANSAPVLQALGVRRVLLVTDLLHMQRAQGVFTRLGFEVERASVPIFIGHEDNTSMLYAGAREAAALAYYYFRGWIGAASVPPHPADEFFDMAPDASFVTHADGPIVMLGASYVASWPITDVAGIPVVVRGVSGQRSFEWLERLDRDVVPVSPRAVVLWGFINDITQADSSQLEQVRTRIYATFTHAVDLARRHGIEPIVATEIPMRTKSSFVDKLAAIVGAIRGKEAYQDRVNREVMTVNAWLRHFARERKVRVLDLEAVLRDQDGRRRARYTQDDGSHITAEGYDALTAFVSAVLERHFTVPTHLP